MELYHDSSLLHNLNVMKHFLFSRSSVISLGSIIHHCPGEMPLWTDAKWSDEVAKLSFCDKGIFTFPISWMSDTTTSLHGKLLCPKCQAKLGSFNWCQGQL